MGAPEGNEYYKLREKNGRDKIFKEPEELLEKAVNYFEWVENNPLYKHDVIRGGDLAGERIKIPLQRPYTIEGFCLFAGITYQTWLNYEKNSDAHEDFFKVTAYIKAVIEANQLEGASVNIFNSNIIARKLGLVDKKENKLEGGDGFKLVIEVPDNKTKKNLERLENESD